MTAAAGGPPDGRGSSGEKAISEQGDLIETRDHPDRSRFEIFVDGDLAGFAEYDLRDGELVFTHTEVDEAFEGRGLGSRLAAAALDDARRRRVRVRPICDFIASYIRSHEEYRDLVVGRGPGRRLGR